MILEKGTFSNEKFEEFSDWFLSLEPNDFTPMVLNGEDAPENFLEQDWVLPKSFNLIDIGEYNYDSNEDLSQARSYIHNLQSENCASKLTCYYPPNGYIGWHTNSNFSGYNIILTFSDSGESYFEYVNEDGEVVRIVDPIGWSYKIVKFDKGENKLWHRAISNCHRITAAYFSSNLEDIQTFKESLI